MKIVVKQYGFATEMNEDGEFRCPHYNVEVEPPCCFGGAIIECGCRGMYSVYCPDCDNEDLTDLEIEVILERGEPDYE